MAKQTINNGETGLQCRDKINENFTEVYGPINKTVPDGGTVGSETTPGAITIAANGDISFAQDLIMAPGKLIGTSGNLDLITIADASVTVDGKLGIGVSPTVPLDIETAGDETVARLAATNALYSGVAFRIEVDRAADSGYEFMRIRANEVNQFVVAGDGRIYTTGNVGVGVTAFGTNATNVLGITADGTVPSSSPAGMIQIFADDSSDGAANATLAIRTEQAVEAGAPTLSHKLKIWINGVEYWLALDLV